MCEFHFQGEVLILYPQVQPPAFLSRWQEGGGRGASSFPPKTLFRSCIHFCSYVTGWSSVTCLPLAAGEAGEPVAPTKSWHSSQEGEASGPWEAPLNLCGNLCVWSGSSANLAQGLKINQTFLGECSKYLLARDWASLVEPACQCR